MFQNNDDSTDKIDIPSLNSTSSSSPKTDNIFKELSWELDFWDTKEEVVEQKKDIEFYLKQAVWIFSILNIFVFFVLVVLFWYVSIQKNPQMKDKAFLDPICSVLLGWVEKTTSSCSSVTAVLSDYQTKKQELSQNISNRIVANIAPFYAVDNFLFSKEVSFLLNLKNSKLPVIDILNQFDIMKTDFTWLDKKIIDCIGFEITSDNILTTNCTAYSSFWTGTNDPTKTIIWETWDRQTSVVEGTSMSIAASFLNFIEKNPDYKFRLLEKQREFTSENILWEWDFVKQTKFTLKLQYSDYENNLSF